MALNMHSFHNPTALQNARALTASFYQLANNSRAIYLTERMLNATYLTKVDNRVRYPVESVLVNSFELTIPQAPQPITTSSPVLVFDAETVTASNILPISEARKVKQGNKASVPTAPAVLEQTSAPIKKQYVWKKGRGAIEKVDRATGEIFHLSELEATIEEAQLAA